MNLSKADKAVQVEHAMKHLLSGRPRVWVSRETGLPSRDVNELTRMLGFKSQELNLKWPLEKYDAIERAVEEDWSLSEIMRTYKADHTAVKRWFPEAGWASGGSARGNLVRDGDDRIKKAMKERGVLSR